MAAYIFKYILREMARGNLNAQTVEQVLCQARSDLNPNTTEHKTSYKFVHLSNLAEQIKVERESRVEEQTVGGL
jgi:hypothetical protein